MSKGKSLGGEYPADYNDERAIFTPAWQESLTGISRDDVIQFAREWATTADKSKGRCSVIIGAGANHWYHNNMIYRPIILALVLTGCVGKNGGGLNHYVGQEKVVPISSWQTVAMGLDWQKPPRVQNTPSFHWTSKLKLFATAGFLSIHSSKKTHLN